MKVTVVHRSFGVLDQARLDQYPLVGSRITMIDGHGRVPDGSKWLVIGVEPQPKPRFGRMASSELRVIITPWREDADPLRR